MYRLFLVFAAAAAVATEAGAQQYQRRASLMGGGSQDSGKCTVEVVVDGAAEVQIRGDQGTIRNLSGQPPQWRRFECTGPVPANAANFRFSGVDGRGRQELVQDPRNGGSAVVRIEDPDGGSEGYTFDLTWGGNYSGGFPNRAYPNAAYPNQAYPGQVYERDRIGNPNRRFTAAQAIQVCQEEVRRRALRQFGGHNIEFLDTRMDDNPGRNDWVIGRIDVLHGPGAPEERLSFSCSVNFNNGRVRSVDLQPGGRYPHNDWRNGSYGSTRAFENCERAVQDRLSREGYGRADFRDTRVDDNPGRRDWVIGNVRAGRQLFGFSCSVDLRDGDVRSVDVRRR